MCSLDISTLLKVQTNKMESESSQADLVAKIDNLLTGKLEAITLRLDSIEQTLSQIDQTEKIDALEKKCKAQEHKAQQLETQLLEVKMHNKRMHEELLQVGMYSRRKNVRIHGLSHQNNPNVEEVVIQKLQEVGIGISPQDIDRVHYIGQHKMGTHRSVLLRLLRWKDKQAILQKKDRLRQMNITIQDDYPSEVQERRKMLLPIFFKALELYPTLNPKFRVDRIILGGKIYTVDNINSIQFPELLPEQVFSPVKDGVQAFFTKYSPLSNFIQPRLKLRATLSDHLNITLRIKKHSILGIQTLHRLS